MCCARSRSVMVPASSSLWFFVVHHPRAPSLHLRWSIDQRKEKIGDQIIARAHTHSRSRNLCQGMTKHELVTPSTRGFVVLCCSDLQMHVFLGRKEVCRRLFRNGKLGYAGYANILFISLLLGTVHDAIKMSKRTHQ